MAEAGRGAGWKLQGHLLGGAASLRGRGCQQPRTIHHGLEVGEGVHGHRGAPGGGLHQHRLGGPGHGAPDRHPQGAEQGVVDRNAHVGVVVAGDRHHRDAGAAQPRQGVGEQRHRLGRRDGAVVEVAGDHHQVHRRLAGQLHDAIERLGLLIEQGGPVEAPPEVPVGGVEQAHGATLGPQQAPPSAGGCWAQPLACDGPGRRRQVSLAAPLAVKLLAAPAAAPAAPAASPPAATAPSATAASSSWSWMWPPCSNAARSERAKRWCANASPTGCWSRPWPATSRAPT